MHDLLTSAMLKGCSRTKPASRENAGCMIALEPGSRIPPRNWVVTPYCVFLLTNHNPLYIVPLVDRTPCPLKGGRGTEDSSLLRKRWQLLCKRVRDLDQRKLISLNRLNGEEVLLCSAVSAQR